MPAVAPNVIVSTTVVGSPALAAETTVAQIVVGSVADAGATVILEGWAAYTVGTSGTAVRFRIRRGSLTGTVVADTGAQTQGRTAGAVAADNIKGVDQPGEVASLAYVLTMQVTAGAAASTVTQTVLEATIVG